VESNEIEYWRNLSGEWYLIGDNKFVNGEELKDRLPVLKISFPYDNEGTSLFYYEHVFLDGEMRMKSYQYDPLKIEGTVNIKNHCYVIDETGNIIRYLNFKILRVSDPSISVNSRIWSKVLDGKNYQGDDDYYSNQGLKFDGYKLHMSSEHLVPRNFKKKFWVLPDKTKLHYFTNFLESETWEIGKL
jgi:hypothetical protein